MNLNMIEEYCPGCGLCQSVFGEHKITVTCSNSGFYKPDFKKLFTKMDYKILKKFCPAYSINKTGIINGKSTNLWGNVYNCFAAYANENEIRENASSGGVITAVLFYLLKNNFIDAAIEVGPDNQNKLLNKTYVNTSLKELLECSNSRYSPSSTLINIIKNINPQKRYALVGKPCDIYAIKKYYRMRNETCNAIKYYLSFFCAGIPSYNGTKELLENFNIGLDNLSELHYRKDGWPGYLKAKTKDGSLYKMSYNESWGTILGRYLGERCYICPDAIGEFADIVCGDAWQDFDEKGYPSFINRKGISLVLTRTDNGDRIFSDMVAKGFVSIFKEYTDLAEIEKMQPFQVARRKTLYAKTLALKLSLHHLPKFDKKIFVPVNSNEFWMDFKRYSIRFFRKRAAQVFHWVRKF